MTTPTSNKLRILVKSFLADREERRQEGAAPSEAQWQFSSALDNALRDLPYSASNLTIIEAAYIGWMAAQPESQSARISLVERLRDAKEAVA